MVWQHLKILWQGKDNSAHVGQLVPAINLSDRGIEEKICMEFNGNG